MWRISSFGSALILVKVIGAEWMSRLVISWIIIAVDILKRVTCRHSVRGLTRQKKTRTEESECEEVKDSD